MTQRTQIILWGAAIITAALFLQASDVSNAASFGVIAGLAGAAIGALSGRSRCKAGRKTS